MQLLENRLHNRATPRLGDLSIGMAKVARMNLHGGHCIDGRLKDAHPGVGEKCLVLRVVVVFVVVAEVVADEVPRRAMFWYVRVQGLTYTNNSAQPLTPCLTDQTAALGVLFSVTQRPQ